MEIRNYPLTPLDWVLPEFELSVDDKIRLLQIGKVPLWTSPSTNEIYAIERDLKFLVRNLFYDILISRKLDNSRVVVTSSEGRRLAHFINDQSEYEL